MARYLLYWADPYIPFGGFTQVWIRDVAGRGGGPQFELQRHANASQRRQDG
jgi:hypothetical protein